MIIIALVACSYGSFVVDSRVCPLISFMVTEVSQSEEASFPVCPRERNNDFVFSFRIQRFTMCIVNGVHLPSGSDSGRQLWHTWTNETITGCENSDWIFIVNALILEYVQHNNRLQFWPGTSEQRCKRRFLGFSRQPWLYLNPLCSQCSPEPFVTRTTPLMFMESRTARASPQSSPVNSVHPLFVKSMGQLGRGRHAKYVTETPSPLFTSTRERMLDAPNGRISGFAYITGGSRGPTDE